jgi:hypothetical protein
MSISRRATAVISLLMPGRLSRPLAPLMPASWNVATTCQPRLGRSLQDLLGVLSEIHAKGVDLYLHQQGIDTSTPAGKALFQMLGAIISPIHPVMPSMPCSPPPDTTCSCCFVSLVALGLIAQLKLA